LLALDRAVACCELLLPLLLLLLGLLALGDVGLFKLDELERLVRLWLEGCATGPAGRVDRLCLRAASGLLSIELARRSGGPPACSCCGIATIIAEILHHVAHVPEGRVVHVRFG
jgi:hypothetical protein